jgi:tRNA pseudouridine32 synthase/23S rRNA pseudouridine746 synthase
VDALLQLVAKETGDEKLYLIHRLDKMTSGLLLLGRHSQAASVLSGLFAHRQVEKYYLALCSKKPKKKQGLIVGDMTKSRRSAWKLLPSSENPAVTQFFSQAYSDGIRAFLCKPCTGKTHQIRVALRSLGSGIIGDSIYGQTEGDRGYLHALSLAFEYQGNLWRFYQWPTQGALWCDGNNHTIKELWAMPQHLPWPELPLSLKTKVLKRDKE